MLQERRRKGRGRQVGFAPPPQRGQVAIRVIVAHGLARGVPHVFLRVSLVCRNACCKAASCVSVTVNARLAIHILDGLYLIYLSVVLVHHSEDPCCQDRGVQI